MEPPVVRRVGLVAAPRVEVRLVTCGTRIGVSQAAKAASTERVAFGDEGVVGGACFDVGDRCVGVRSCGDQAEEVALGPGVDPCGGAVCECDDGCGCGLGDPAVDAGEGGLSVEGEVG